jgi:hypothetical protein
VTRLTRAPKSGGCEIDPLQGIARFPAESARARKPVDPRSGEAQLDGFARGARDG